LGDVVNVNPVNLDGVSFAEAVDDPFNWRMGFVRRFVDITYLRNVITDTHFNDRLRQARMLAFLARMMQPVPEEFGDEKRVEILGKGVVARGVGVD
jgi:cyanophycinase-like exopeptidase